MSCPRAQHNVPGQAACYRISALTTGPQLLLILFVCVQVRQCISHMWSIIVKSSLSSTGVAQEVVACEKQVFEKKL